MANKAAPLLLESILSYIHLNFRELKYEQDLEFYATARQLRWHQLKLQRKKTLKQLQKEKFEHRFHAQKTTKEVKSTKKLILNVKL